MNNNLSGQLNGGGIKGLVYDDIRKRFDDPITNISYFVYDNGAAFEESLANWARLDNEMLAGWAVLSTDEYKAFSIANGAPGSPTAPFYFFVVVGPFSAQGPTFSDEESTRQNAFQALFQMFMLNARNGFNVLSFYAVGNVGFADMHFAIKTKHPSGDVYDLFTIQAARERVFVNPITTSSTSASYGAQILKSSFNPGVGGRELQMLSDELSEPGMRFGSDEDYGLDNALFHPFFAPYYRGKVNAAQLPVPLAARFEEGHLKDWTLNTDTVYKSTQMARVKAIEDGVANAIQSFIKAPKSSAAEFNAFLKTNVKSLIDLYESNIAADAASVNDGRDILIIALDKLGLKLNSHPIPDHDYAIKNFTNKDGVIIPVNENITSRFLFYSLGFGYTYYPDGLRNSILVLLELIARVSTEDLSRPRIDNATLHKLAETNTSAVPDTAGTFTALIEYMKPDDVRAAEAEAKLKARFADARAKFDARENAFFADTGRHLSTIDLDIITEADLAEWDKALDRIVDQGYWNYRSAIMDEMITYYDNAVSKIGATMPAISRTDFLKLVEDCRNSKVQLSKKDLEASPKYQAVAQAVLSVQNQKPPAPPELDEFVNPSPAVAKALEALKASGVTPTPADIDAIKAAGKRVPYNPTFASNSQDYVSLMQGYGEIKSKSVRAIAINPNATPLALARAEAYTYGKLKLGTDPIVKRKAQSFGQLVLKAAAKGVYVPGI